MEESFPTVEVEFACRTCSVKGKEGQGRAAKCLEMSFKYFKVNLHGRTKTCKDQNEEQSAKQTKFE